jgi:hypothetical protein
MAEIGQRIGSPEFERVRPRVAARRRESSATLRAMATVYRVGASEPRKHACIASVVPESASAETPVSWWVAVTAQIEEERKQEIAELLLIKAAAEKRAKRKGGKARQPSRSLSPRIAAVSRCCLTASRFRAKP